VTDCQLLVTTPIRLTSAYVSVMKTVGFLLSIVGVVCSEDVVDESGVSLLQHNVRTIRKTEAAVDDPPGPPPAGVAERQAARRERRRAARQAARQEGGGPSNLSPERLEIRRSRRRAKRQAKRRAHAAGQAHFNDGGTCDTCAAHCTAIFNDEIKECLIREGCRPWLKEDGAADVEKCNKRCDRSANWLREPCIRACQCDVDLLGSAKASKKTTQHVDWAEGHHRCRAVPLGSISTCPSVAEHADSTQYDSIKKCAKAAAQAGANTFNFYRTSKEFGKCSLRECSGGDLQASVGPREPEAPAGRGTWKVFSTFCDAAAEGQRHDTGAAFDDDASR